MPTWIIEPHDPLIVRDGRPFGTTPGGRAASLAFPFPSTTTGGIRARIGPDEQGQFSPERIDYLKQVSVRGPLLVEVSENDSHSDIKVWLVPAPADALLLEPEALLADQQTADTNAKEKQSLRKRLIPLEALGNPQSSTNLPAELLLVGQVLHSEGKPKKQVPRFWYWEQFEHWLTKPPQFEDTVTMSSLGHSGPMTEARMHVSIDVSTQTASEGALFQTRGLEFTLPGEIDASGADHRISDAQRLALAVVSEQADFAPCVAALGGERRMVCWRKSAKSLPDIPAELMKQVQDDKACRVILLTSACFDEGWLPTWLLAEREGVQPDVKAIAIQRPQVVSGWDFEKRGPKPTRRLAPAGSVFFLKLTGEPEAIARWIQAIWMQCVSDNEQDRRDGFGLAVVGTWDGHPQAMQLKGEQS